MELSTFPYGNMDRKWLQYIHRSHQCCNSGRLQLWSTLCKPHHDKEPLNGWSCPLSHQRIKGNQRHMSTPCFHLSYPSSHVHCKSLRNVQQPCTSDSFFEVWIRQISIITWQCYSALLQLREANQRMDCSCKSYSHLRVSSFILWFDGQVSSHCWTLIAS